MTSVGIVVPSHRLPWEAERDVVGDLRSTAEAAALAGADTLWVWDHMLKAPVYRNSWHDPLVSLAAVADYGLRLGTGILVAPVRPAVQTTMAIASLQALSGQPMRLGLGTGWNPTEFEAAGVSLRHRGAMTDEFLDVLAAIFRGDSEFQGQFTSFSDLDAGHVGDGPEIWIAGGSRRAGRGTADVSDPNENQMMAAAVARRITAHGRWLVRPSAEVSDYERDIAALEAASGPDDGADSVELGIINVAHIVETDDPDEARRQQHPVYRTFVSDKRPPEYLEDRYLLGTIDEIRARVTSWTDVGMSHVGLYLLGDTPAQVALARKHLGDLLDFAPR